MFAGDEESSEALTGLPADAAALEAMIDRLRDHGCTGDGDAERVTQIGMLETLKSLASAVQAVLTADFARSREVELVRIATESVRDRARRDVGAQVGLARRVSPRIGARLVGLATVLTGEMPQLMNAFRRGAVDEYQALLVVAETTTLSLEHRQIVDAELATRFGAMSAARARASAAVIGYRLDPEQAVRRLRKAHADRRVTLRPAPDTMSYLTALLPAAEGVAALAALTRHAATATAHGDERGTGALMADEFVARLLRSGASCADHMVDPIADPEDAATVDHLTEGLPTAPAGVGIEIQLVMTDRTLLDGDMEPAVLTGYGPIPAPLARHLARGAGARTTAWVRRLYADPDTGVLVRSDPRRRLFGHAERQFLIARDQVCRTPWCDAPIRHADHTRPHSSDGPTDIGNGAGLCAACNQIKEQPGWTHETRDGGEILVRTPTGHDYVSRPPDAPHSEPWELVA